jgi:hypothetical protein
MKSQAVLLMASLVAVGGCKKSVQSTDNSEASVAMVAATAPDNVDLDAAVEVTPPAALVAADPNIPLNEAVVGAAPIPTDYTADTAPPTPVVEQQPPSPEVDDTWVPGYWWWSRPLTRYVWVSGAWRHPPPDQVWFPGAWNPSGGRYAWAPGYWGPRGATREFIDVGPPPMRVEMRPPPPGAEFSWTPGYYAYRGGSYNWVGGSWARPPSAGVSWVEPRYVSTGGRYYLQPGRWDFAPEHRGVAYQPDINVRPGMRVTLAPVPPAVVAVHANFVNDSARAVARGAERTPNGGFVMPHAAIGVATRPVVDEHARVDEHGHVDEHARVDTHVQVAPNDEQHRGVVNSEEHRVPNAQEHQQPEVHATVGRPIENAHANPNPQENHERVAPHPTAEVHAPTPTATHPPPNRPNSEHKTR